MRRFWGPAVFRRDRTTRLLTLPPGSPVSAGDPTAQQLLWALYTDETTVQGMLATGDGQCTTWTKLFLDMLLIDGVSGPNDYVTVVPAHSEGFLVNNWSFVGTATSGNPSYPYLDNVLTGNYDVVKQPGAKDRVRPIPSPHSVRHVIAYINGKCSASCGRNVRQR